MIPLPFKEESANIRALARLEQDTFTGVVGATVTLSQNPVENYLWIWKNGLLLTNIGGADWTVAGEVVTFAVALVAGDKVLAFYWTRAN